MAIKEDKVNQATLVTEKPVTDVTKKSLTKGEMDFNVAVGIIAGAWIALGALIYSLRKYNV